MTNNPFLPYSGHNKLSALLSGPNYSLTDKAARMLTRLWETWVPEGHQDETGFHHAQAPSETKPVSTATPAWLGEHI